MDARRAAVAALLRIQEQGGYSNLVLEDLLTHSDLAEADRALASRLLYGVTERRLTLDYLLNKTATTPVKQMHPSVREILRVGAYQLVYMDKTPAFAAINEAVGHTRHFGCGRLSGFVNGVLRQVQRQSDALLAALPANDKGLEITHSLPRAWIRQWRQAYGEDVLQGLLSSLGQPPATYIRVNTCVTTAAALRQQLEQVGAIVQPVAGLPDALCISSAAALRRLPGGLQSHFYIQDIASQWCCAALEARPGERVADVCAAPGGKTMTVAQYMGNIGHILAGDIHDHKCRALAERVKQFGFTSVSVRQQDASQPYKTDLAGTFDRVVCDAPCSGMGVIRRKPEIRYKQPEEFADLPALQLQILTQAATLVKSGGVLQYSTCTLRPEENEAVVAAFLEQHPDFSPRRLPLSACFAASGLPVSHQITLFPHIHGTDGFFIAGFYRNT